MTTDQPRRTLPRFSGREPGPFCHELATVDEAADPTAQRRPLPALADSWETGAFGQLRGRSAPMLELYRQIDRVAPTTATVLLAGETGTGKEVVARAIHERSDRRHAAFVAINCGAISATLVESELFGHEQGSFTGAARRHHGMFTQADKGTLFLDEITEMSADLQVRLLRVLETGCFHRVGGEKQVQTDVRVIAAANRPLGAAVRAGRLREDLFYRLRGFPITLPPLRDRSADIELLANHFLELLNQQSAGKKRFTAVALERMSAHAWPGNVRDLKHFVHHAFILADRDIDAESLAPSVTSLGDGAHIEIRVGSSIAVAERQLITATMVRCQGDKATAAKALGISIKTLYARLAVYAGSEPANA